MTAEESREPSDEDVRAARATAYVLGELPADEAAAAALGVAVPGYHLATQSGQMSGDGYKNPIAFADREHTAPELIPPEGPVTPKNRTRLRLESQTGISLPDPAGRRWNAGEVASGNTFGSFDENPFVLTSAEAKSTFSIDVDTASYAILRTQLNSGALPPKQAVRIEEMLNYFSYDYARPTSDVPFSISLEMGVAPWAERHRLVRIGLRGKDVALEEKEGANLVFLIDTSGSMNAANKPRSACCSATRRTRNGGLEDRGAPRAAGRVGRRVGPEARDSDAAASSREVEGRLSPRFLCACEHSRRGVVLTTTSAGRG